ncbi:hypothetical protein DFH09DRAFT_852966, partial [Mycena vulgaris]
LTALARILCVSFNDRIERRLLPDAPAYVGDFDGLRARPRILETPPPWVGRIPPLA